ncbi:hypothetical protein DPMN_013807 [Dreissena polymorpha]|uniref:Uncharacterized protein n=1 Tax=Dreissena polymorpha TaxID=45954 RepID=A0A9D4N640_DREPO|nr:hypothetical protein DPMN_013807 [Dreissena polymorpha]
MLDGQCQMVDMYEILPAAHKRPDWRRISVSSYLILHPNDQAGKGNNDDEDDDYDYNLLTCVQPKLRNIGCLIDVCLTKYLNYIFNPTCKRN